LHHEAQKSSITTRPAWSANLKSAAGMTARSAGATDAGGAPSAACRRDALALTQNNRAVTTSNPWENTAG